MPQWFITYPQRLATRNCYRIVDAPDIEQARALAFAHHGTAWAFIYPIEELAAQVERFELTEVAPPLRDGGR